MCLEANSHLKVIEKSIIPRINVRPWGITCMQTCKKPISSWTCFKVQHFLNDHFHSSAHRYESLSWGRQASMASESSSSPKSSRQVVGQMVFAGWKDRLRSLERPSIQSIASLAHWVDVDGMNTGKKSSRYWQRMAGMCRWIIQWRASVNRLNM